MVCELYPTKAVTKYKTKQNRTIGLFSQGMKSVSQPGEMSGALQSAMGNWVDYVIHSPEI